MIHTYRAQRLVIPKYSHVKNRMVRSFEPKITFRMLLNRKKKKGERKYDVHSQERFVCGRIMRMWLPTCARHIKGTNLLCAPDWSTRCSTRNNQPEFVRRRMNHWHQFEQQLLNFHHQTLRPDLKLERCRYIISLIVTFG